jgi:hypothetical protein
MMKTWMLYDGEKIEGVSTVDAESKEDALLRMCEMLNNDSEVYNYVVTGEEIYQYEGVIQDGDEPVGVYDVEEVEEIDQKYEEENKMTREQELAEEIRSSQEWDLDQLRELCELADMEAEWEAADGETFEQVAFQAAEKLGVEIM